MENKQQSKHRTRNWSVSVRVCSYVGVLVFSEQAATCVWEGGALQNMGEIPGGKHYFG